MSKASGQTPRRKTQRNAPPKMKRSFRPHGLSSRLPFIILSADGNREYSCGHFMAMIFGDYVAGFLGLARDGSGWSMNPFDVCLFSFTASFMNHP